MCLSQKVKEKLYFSAIDLRRPRKASIKTISAKKQPHPTPKVISGMSAGAKGQRRPLAGGGGPTHYMNKAGLYIFVFHK